MLGYIFGSLPFSVWVTRPVKNADMRNAGSGHAITGELVIAYRFLIDWNGKYRELWLDQEKQ
jgi:hypothetical protein